MALVIGSRFRQAQSVTSSRPITFNDDMKQFTHGQRTSQLVHNHRCGVSDTAYAFNATGRRWIHVRVTILHPHQVLSMPCILQFSSSVHSANFAFASIEFLYVPCSFQNAHSSLFTNQQVQQDLEVQVQATTLSLGIET